MRRTSHLIAPTLVLCLQGPTSAQANELLGCWKSEKIAQFLADGRSRTNTFNGTIEFTRSEVISRGLTSQQQRSEIRYSYVVVRPGVYATTMTSHTLRPDLVGTRQESEYKVEGDLLVITAFPQAAQPAPPTTAVRVQSTSRKIDCSMVQQLGPAQPTKS
ncbi:MAG TPA: hypothetical protein VIN58_16580 [Roseateles sp.]